MFIINITLNTATYFGLQVIIIRESNQSGIYKTKLAKCVNCINLANLILCGTAWLRFPDDDHLRTETCSNVRCHIIIQICKKQMCAS